MMVRASKRAVLLNFTAGLRNYIVDYRVPTLCWVYSQRLTTQT